MMLPSSRRLSPQRLSLLLFALLPLAVLISLASGPVLIGAADLLASLPGNDAESSTAALIVSAIRAPRTALAALIGATLAISGAAMQGLFRNPLADPSLIGVTSGASAGASCIIVLSGGWLAGSQWLALPLVGLGASLGGLIAVVVVYRIATGSSGTSVQSMLLAGIAISALAGALNSLFSYFADNDMLRRISLWQMGSLDGANWLQVGLAAAVTVLLLALLPRDSAALNALLLGESEARHLGIDVERLKRRLVVLTALGVGATVAIAGVIAFVGLLVPHFVRLLIGPDHRHVLPTAAAAGAILVLLADSVARVIVAPAELPTGVLTALLGAPVFFSLLAHKDGASLT